VLSEVFARSKLVLEFFWVMKQCNVVGNTDISGNAFDLILRLDKNLRIGSKAYTYPEMGYLSYNTRVIIQKIYIFG
jgi:hypothetical protein